jgi:hypothetical protein
MQQIMMHWLFMALLSTAPNAASSLSFGPKYSGGGPKGRGQSPPPDQP